MISYALCFIAFCLQAQNVVGDLDHPMQADFNNALANLELICTDIMVAQKSDLVDALLRKFDQAGDNSSFLDNSVSLISETCQLLSGRDGSALLLDMARIGADFLTERQLQDSRRRLGDVDEPWFADSQTYAIGFICVGLPSLCAFVLLYEHCFIKSSLKFGKLEKLSSSLEKHLTVEGIFNSRHNKKKEAEVSKPIARTRSAVAVDKFWKNVNDIAKQDRGDDLDVLPEEHYVDVIGFSRPTFAAYECDGVAKIALQRWGICKGIVEVRVHTQEDRSKTDFAAKSGSDFEHFEDVVRFEDGETHKSLNIKLLSRKALWLPTRSFLIELSSVVSGGARLQHPPAVELQQDSTGPTMPGPTASVKILESARFPAGMPEKDESDWCKVIFWYIKDRIHDRKEKFWNTLRGVLYDPFHVIMVRFLVQKALIDWAALPSREGGSYGKVILLATIYMFSSSLYRWGDTVQVKQRGRTGGCRMVHRQQILTKMLMLEHAEHLEVPDYHWFYTAIVDVDTVVMDAYWEFIMFLKIIFALLLCVLTIAAGVVFKLVQHGGNKSFEIYAPAFFVMLMLPFTALFYHARKHTHMTLLDKRLTSGEAWVETFGWLSQTSSNLYAISAQELADLENMYKGQAKVFVSHHQRARDYFHDTLWISKWISFISYCLFICVGGFCLYQDREFDKNEFEIGDLVILMEVYYKFGRYLSLLFDSIARMQRGAVSIKRIAKLLNMKEHRSLHDSKDLAQDTVTAERLELHEVQLTFPKATFSPMGPLEFASGSVHIVPLGKVVMIEGAPEPTLMSISALLGQVLYPTRGCIVCPHHLSAKMLPPIPVSTPPRFLVRHAFQSICGSEQTALDLAFALGLDPSCAVESLGLGQKQLLALGRTMLVDPDILVLVRPLGCLSCEHKRRVSHLLRMWQAGGAHLLLHTLSLNVCQESHGFEEKTYFEKITRSQKRSLIMTGEPLSGNTRGDVTIDFSTSDLVIGGFDASADMPALETKEIAINIQSETTWEYTF